MPLSNGVESAFALNSNTFSDKKKMLFRNFGVKVITQMTQFLRRLQITRIAGSADWGFRGLQILKIADSKDCPEQNPPTARSFDEVGTRMTRTRRQFAPFRQGINKH